VDAPRHPPAHQPSAKRVRLLLLLRHGWATAAGIFHPLHADGVLRAPIVVHVAALPHYGADLHPLLRDDLLKQHTTSEKEKEEERKKRLDVMEVLYSKRQAVADKLDAQT
jgi:hypothetical protein